MWALQRWGGAGLERCRGANGANGVKPKNTIHKKRRERIELARWAAGPNRVGDHRRQRLHQLGIATLALVSAGEGGAKGERQRAVEGEDTSRGDVGAQAFLTDEVPDGLPEMRQLLAECARIEALSRLIGAIERRDHGQLATGFGRSGGVFGRVRGGEERPGKWPLALSAHALARLEIGGVA